MDAEILEQDPDTNQTEVKFEEATPKGKQRVRSRKKDGSSAGEDAAKRRCVSTACIGIIVVNYLHRIRVDIHQHAGNVNQSLSSLHLRLLPSYSAEVLQKLTLEFA